MSSAKTQQNQDLSAYLWSNSPALSFDKLEAKFFLSAIDRLP